MTKQQQKRTRRAFMEGLETRVLMHGGAEEGTGLLGQYYDNKDFTNLKLTRTDTQVNFSWGTGSPGSGIGADTFSVRWTGQLVPHVSEKYTFYTSSDDGIRLWVDGKMIIDKLKDQPLTSATSLPIALTAGQAVDIRVDYYDNTGQATAKLSWSSPSTPKEIIPVDHLYATAPPVTPPPVTPPPPAAIPIRIDAAGSKTYTDATGKTWIADKYFTGGATSLGLFDIAGTTDDTFYATRRCGTSFSYNIPIPAAGDYTLNLLFADASYAPGGRLFNVTAEGSTILKNFDVVGSAGKGVAITKSFPITINDGTLNLSFKSVLNNATISAIEIVPAATGPTIDWKAVASAPTVRAESLGGVVNGKLYSAGGLYADSDAHILATSRVDVYDPQTDTWTQLNDEPEPITHAGVAIDGTTIWFVGGYVGNHPAPATAHVWKYDTLTDTWTPGPELPAARGAGAAAIVGRELHFVGGMEETRTIDEGEHWSLNLDDPEGTWVSRAPLSNPRNHVSAASLNGKLYAIGGQYSQESSQIAQSTVECYDPATDTWTLVASLPGPRSHINESTFVMDGKIIVLGGEIGYNLPQNTVYSYDPTLNQWDLIGLLPANRSTSIAGVIGDHQIISATGNSPYPTNNVWIGTLPTPPAAT
jgi:N-acetylneuraminic acid mutarotase